MIPIEDIPKITEWSNRIKLLEINNQGDNKYTKLIKNLNANSIGVNSIIETPNFIGLELTQFTHPNLDVVEQIIEFSTHEAGIDKEIKKELEYHEIVHDIGMEMSGQMDQEAPF